MKNNVIAVALVVAIVAGGAGFFGGMKHQESKTPEFIRNLPSDFQERMGQFGQRANVSGGTNTVRGEIVSMDDSSVTVRLADDSSKIVILTNSTGINKSEEGSTEDLSEGIEIMVIGQTNSDGSVTAQNIQIGSKMFREATE